MDVYGEEEKERNGSLKRRENKEEETKSNIIN